MIKKINKIILSFTITFIVLISTVVSNPVLIYAQTADTCNPEIKKNGLFPDLVICGRSVNSSLGNSQNTEMCQLKHIPIVFGNLIQFAIIFVLLLIPIYIMYIGVRMIMAQGIPEDLKKLKTSLYSAVLYFILIFAAWLIVKTLTESLGVSSDIPSFLLNKDCSIIQNVGAPTTSK